MTQPLNPNTLLPMSLEVDKIQQAKQLQNLEHQGLISQQRKTENHHKQNQVNSKDETDSVRVSEEESEENETAAQNSAQENENNKEEEKDKKTNQDKGKYIDIKI